MRIRKCDYGKILSNITIFRCYAFIYSILYNKKGVKVKQYSETGILFYGTFKSYGGTEQNVNNVYSIIDTAVIDTWYRPDITSECKIKINEEFYEIINKPENIEMRNQYLRFKVKRVDSNV